jgi:hypothetical protein
MFVAMFDNLWDQVVAYDKFKETDRMKDEYIRKQREPYDRLLKLMADYESGAIDPKTRTLKRKPR